MADGISVISVVGTGYVGLVTGACLARLGHRVRCIDVDIDKIDNLQRGVIPFYERHLEGLVKDGLRTGTLTFSTDLLSNVIDSDFVFLCLPTPQKYDGSADLDQVTAICRALNGQLRDDAVVVVKSTVPPRTVHRVQLLLDFKYPVVSNPEFLREGNAVQDFMEPDRVVVGSDNEEARQRVADLYLSINRPILQMDPVSAETLKYVANAYLALRISYINDTARLCGALGADIEAVLEGLSFDGRIGSQSLYPGPGWGGSCFPKDTRALSVIARAVSSPMTLVENAITANEKHILEVSKLIKARIRPDFSKLGILGLSFKANTDDIRESPALRVIEQLFASQDLTAYDPLARVPEYMGITQVETLGEAVRDADLLVILTEWEEFRNLDPRMVAAQMRGREIVDTRYLLDRKAFASHDLDVYSVGLKDLIQEDF